jgi:hypothetical protein
VTSSSCLPGLPGVYPYNISPLHEAPLNTTVLMLKQKLANQNNSAVLIYIGAQCTVDDVSAMFTSALSRPFFFA